jgi:hypothetical protein
MEDIDVNILIQVFNEKISSLMTDIVIKDTTIRQLSMQLEALKESSSNTVPSSKKENQDFE